MMTSSLRINTNVPYYPLVPINRKLRKQSDIIKYFLPYHVNGNYAEWIVVKWVEKRVYYDNTPVPHHIWGPSPFDMLSWHEIDIICSALV